MQQRVNIITLGVKDLQTSREFYEKLGWKAASISNDQIVAFEANGLLVCFYPWDLLAEDAHSQPKGEGFRGVTLAYNAYSKEEVRQILAEAVEAGATLVKEAQEVFWGGYSGYFADLNGHFWEVAWNPIWPLKQDGTLELPK